MKKVAIIILALTVVTVNAQEKGKKLVVSPSTALRINSTEPSKIINPKTMKTASGLEYTIKEKGNGKKPKVGDKVFVHYTGKFTNDTVFDSSVNRGAPFSFKLGAGQVIKGWDEAFLLLEVGDKATIKFGPELGYGDRQSGAIPANSTLIFDVELLNIVESLQAWDVKGKDTVTMANGLKYIVLKENKSAAKASVGNNVTLHYSGFFKDGKGFDSSVEREQPFTVKMGSGQLIKALEDGIALMHKGDKVKFYIPYQLAYGEQGHAPAIPPKADLIFDIEILDVVPVLAPALFDITGKEAKTTASGLKYYEIVKSSNPIKAAPGKTVRVHYSGYLADGKMFDSSVERGEPFEFVLGQAQVIPGWDEGIALMNVGDKLRLLIPYYLAYGEQGRLPMIPEKADLTFDVELIGVDNYSVAHNPDGETMKQNIKLTTPSGDLKIKMTNDNGIFKIPVKINDLAEIDFIFDTGASETTVTADVVSTMIRQKIISLDDFLPGATYVLADGSRIKSNRFIIKKLEIGGTVLKNINASITSQHADPLLGQNVLGIFKSIKQNKEGYLIIEKDN